MTKEEIIEAISEDKMMPFIQPEQLAEIVNFVIKNYKPSLPSNLDEAANNYGIDIRLGYPRVMDETDRYIYNAFKAGAEWMAGQGVNTDFEVCKLANRAWLTAIDEKKFAQDIFDNFGAGDKVVVQIRKK